MLSERIMTAGVKPLLMEKAPAVLATGYRCMEEGYGFYWPPYMAVSVISAPVFSAAAFYLHTRLVWPRFHA